MNHQSNSEFPFQSGSSLCYASTDYTGGTKKKTKKIGGNKKYTNLLADNYVSPKSNYSNYGLIPKVPGNNVSYVTGVKNNKFLEANDYGIIYKTSGGKKSNHKLNMNKKSNTKAIKKNVSKKVGGDKTSGATGLPSRFYTNAVPQQSCNFGETQNRNIGMADLSPMSPKCMVGASKRKVGNKGKKIKKGGDYCYFSMGSPMYDKISGPMKGLTDGVTKFENYVEGIEARMKAFGEKMMHLNIPKFNRNQTGGKGIKLTKNFDNYVRNLLSAMEHFKLDVSSLSNNKHLKSKKQVGGLNFIQGDNLDLPNAPNHPMWSTAGGKKKVTRKKTVKSRSKATKTKKKIMFDSNTTVEIATLYDKIMVLKGQKKTSTKTYKNHVKTFKFRTGLSPTEWAKLIPNKKVAKKRVVKKKVVKKRVVKKKVVKKKVAKKRVVKKKVAKKKVVKKRVVKKKVVKKRVVKKRVVKKRVVKPSKKKTQKK